MKVLNLDPFNFSLKAKLKLLKYFEYQEISTTTTCFDLNILSDFDILIIKFSIKLDEQTLIRCKKLKYILCPATGTDHIDNDYCKKNGIIIISLFQETHFLNDINSSAEHTWALLMSAYKRVTESFEFTKLNSVWERNSFQTRDLFNKKIGIVGFGRNGKKIAKYANAFGMIVMVYDKDEITNEFKHFDIIVLSISLNADTKNLIGSKLLNSITKNCFLINTSRGEIVDEESIIQALKYGNLAYYATDVLCNEYDYDFLYDSKLFQYSKYHSNVLITPHIAGSNLDSWEKTDNFVVDKLLKIIELNGKN